MSITLKSFPKTKEICRSRKSAERKQSDNDRRRYQRFTALSAADVGIAISDGAEIAREIADNTIAADDLGEIVVLKEPVGVVDGKIHW